tara:strand:+ start:21 stop:1631 length:1611 start_codon:yes stop_codon:yes gene_type:complete
MPNSVKYNTNAESLALNAGDFWIGTGDVAKGPTSTTGFWNGINPPSSGYTIYQNKESQGPSIMVAADDAELITITNQIAGTSYTTVNECFLYFAGEDDKTVMNMPIRETTTDGCNIFLDVNNSLSYPGSGTTVYDMSGNANNATLNNSVGIDSNGYMVFDGVDDNIGITNNSTLQGWATSQTLAIWTYHTFTTNRRVIWNQAYGGYGTWTHENGGSISQYFGDSGANSQPYVGRGSNTTPKSQWNLNVATRSTSTHKWYQNGVNTRTTTNPYGVLATTNGNITIGYGYTGNYWEGKMGSIMTWDEVLTADQVSALWYGGPIVTDGLSFSINAGILGSYEPGSTTAYDQTTNDNNGTLSNGVSFTPHYAGGVWGFDSVDDYIDLPNNLEYSTDSVSVFSWYKINGSPGGSYHIICGGSQLEMSIHSSATYLRSGLNTTDGRFVNNNGSQTLDDGNYHYYGFTFDGSTKRTYIDGVEVGTQAVTGTLTTSFSNRRLGRFGSSTTYYANGDMGLYTIWDKVLSAAEVQQNYNANINLYD